CDPRIRFHSVPCPRQYPRRPGGIPRRVLAGVVDELTRAVLDAVDHRAPRDEAEPVSVEDRRSWQDQVRPVTGPVRIDAIEIVHPGRGARPPEIVAVDSRAGCLDPNDRSDIVGIAAHMTHDDLGVVMPRNGRSGAGPWTAIALVTFTVQVVPEAVSQPSHPLKIARTSGATVSVTTVPKSNETEHVGPQLIWVALAGLEVDVTVPLPTPKGLDLVTVTR